MQWSGTAELSGYIYIHTAKAARSESAAPDIDIRIGSNPNITNFVMLRTGLWIKRLNFENAGLPTKIQP